MEHRDIKDIAKNVRKNLKTELPDCKFSVTIDRFAGGQTLYVVILSAPEQVLVDGAYHQINHYCVNTSKQLTKYGRGIIDLAVKISNKENWDKSDSMTDYFDVNYYFSISVGKK